MTKSMRFRQLITAALLLPLLAMSFSIQAEDKDKSRSTSVTVNNTNANPVPVNGNVNVSGTANVNVTNTVPVTGNVGVSGTVNIGNMPPVSVQSSNPESFVVPFQFPPTSITMKVDLPKPAILEALTCDCGSFGGPVTNNAYSFTLAVDQSGNFALPTGTHLSYQTYTLAMYNLGYVPFGPFIADDPAVGTPGPIFNYSLVPSTADNTKPDPLIVSSINIPVISDLTFYISSPGGYYFGHPPCKGNLIFRFMN